MKVIDENEIYQRDLKGFLQWIIMLISSIILIVVIDQTFHFGVFNFILQIESSYLYILLCLYVSTVFIIYPVIGGEKYKKGYFLWIDLFLSFLTIFIGFIFCLKGLTIFDRGWAMASPMPYSILGFLFWFIVIEATRRSQGLILTIFITFFSLYPLFAGEMPGFLNGLQFNILQTMNYHVFSIESLIGLPMKVTGDLVIGFMVFGLVLVTTGGAGFFMDFAMSLLGTSRGGAAKVSVFSSALFGSMSGSAISNVITTGTVTIPAMVKTGFPSHFAGAVEACASTGGVLMPPVMGATAFLVAQFLNIPYLEVALAASVPSLLYYFGLLIQVDAYAARHNLTGLPRNELPSLKRTMTKGWYYLGAILVLLFFLYLRVEQRAPFYASTFLIICSFFKKETRINLEKIKIFLINHIKSLAGLIAVISAIGLIIGSLSITGVAQSMTREIIYFSHGNLYLMVLFGALTSFILGMGITITACYVLLAITLAPSLVEAGLNPLAVHLFLMYMGMISYITLPVATAVYAAAAIARSRIMDVGLTAMRLGVVTYFVPFFFVFNDALIFNGPFLKCIYHILLAIIGVFIIASALGGYIIRIGPIILIKYKKIGQIIIRPCLVISGLLLAIPEKWTDLIGILLGLSIIGIFIGLRKGDCGLRKINR